MALYTLILAVCLGCVRALVGWRLAFYALAVIVAIQDPLRKLIPGTPGWVVMATGPVLIIAAVQMMLTQPQWLSAFRASYPAVVRAMGLLVLAAIPPALISATYGPGSWKFTLLGIGSYGVLLISIVMGYHIPQSITALRRMFGFYCCVSTIMFSGSFIEYLGLMRDSPVIGTEVLGMQWIRYSGDYVVDLISGFYRSPDVMGWHAAATVMLCIILALTSARGGRVWWLLLGAVALGALLLCGRRKMVFMIPVFLALVVCLYWAYAGKQSRGALYATLLFSVLGFSLVGNSLTDDSAQVRYYVDNAVDSLDQLERHAFDSVIETYNQAGFFGNGLGMATPGSHQIDAARPPAWQESGPSRVMVELGVPGFLALIMLVLSLLRAASWVTSFHLRTASPYGLYVAGLMAFFTVNVGSLMVSGQILADPFIASFIGMSLGIVLSFGRFYPQSAEPAPAPPSARTAMAVMPPWVAVAGTRPAAQSEADLRYPPSR